jgi:hypothetical protein
MLQSPISWTVPTYALLAGVHDPGPLVRSVSELLRMDVSVHQLKLHLIILNSAKKTAIAMK